MAAKNAKWQNKWQEEKGESFWDLEETVRGLNDRGLTTELRKYTKVKSKDNAIKKATLLDSYLKAKKREEKGKGKARSSDRSGREDSDKEYEREEARRLRKEREAREEKERYRIEEERRLNNRSRESLRQGSRRGSTERRRSVTRRERSRSRDSPRAQPVRDRSRESQRQDSRRTERTRSVTPRRRERRQESRSRDTPQESALRRSRSRELPRRDQRDRSRDRGGKDQRYRRGSRDRSDRQQDYSPPGSWATNGTASLPAFERPKDVPMYFMGFVKYQMKQFGVVMYGDKQAHQFRLERFDEMTVKKPPDWEENWHLNAPGLVWKKEMFDSTIGVHGILGVCFFSPLPGTDFTHEASSCLDPVLTSMRKSAKEASDRQAKVFHKQVQANVIGYTFGMARRRGSDKWEFAARSLSTTRNAYNSYTSPSGDGKGGDWLIFDAWVKGLQDYMVAWGHGFEGYRRTKAMRRQAGKGGWGSGEVLREGSTQPSYAGSRRSTPKVVEISDDESSSLGTESESESESESELDDLPTKPSRAKSLTPEQRSTLETLSKAGLDIGKAAEILGGVNKPTKKRRSKSPERSKSLDYETNGEPSRSRSYTADGYHEKPRDNGKHRTRRQDSNGESSRSGTADRYDSGRRKTSRGDTAYKARRSEESGLRTPDSTRQAGIRPRRSLARVDETEEEGVHGRSTSFQEYPNLGSH